MEFTTMRSNTTFILYNNVTLNNETSFNNAMYKYKNSSIVVSKYGRQLIYQAKRVVVSTQAFRSSSK